MSSNGDDLPISFERGFGRTLQTPKPFFDQVGDFVVVADSEGGGSALKLLDWLRLEGKEQPGPVLRALNPDPRYGPFLYDNTNDRFRVIGVVVDSQLPAYKRRSARP